MGWDLLCVERQLLKVHTAKNKCDLVNLNYPSFFFETSRSFKPLCVNVNNNDGHNRPLSSHYHDITKMSHISHVSMKWKYN